MMGSEGISVADAIALRNSGYSDGNNGFGGDNGWWIVLLILLFAGGRGFGGWGGNGGDSGYNACCVPATHQGMTDAFNFSQLDNGIRGLERGLCDGFYSTAQGINTVTSAVQNCCCDVKSALCSGFNGTNQAIANLGYNVAQGFCGVDKSILQSDFHAQAGFNALGNQLASCCCDLERGQEAIKCALEKATGDILISNERNTNQIISYLTQTEMDKLRTELQSAQFQLSQLSQTSNIVEQLLPVAKPAYLTCSPYAAAFGFNGYNGFGYGNNGCGCNSCC